LSLQEGARVGQLLVGCFPFLNPVAALPPAVE
jgi:hypothetical protein